TVLGDICDNVPCTACCFELLKHIPNIAAFLDPASGCQLFAPNIEAYSDLVAVLFDYLSRPLWALQRSSTKLDPGGAPSERFVQASVAPSTPRPLPPA